jgi:hypothetical protein
VESWEGYGSVKKHISFRDERNVIHNINPKHALYIERSKQNYIRVHHYGAKMDTFHVHPTEYEKDGGRTLTRCDEE